MFNFQVKEFDGMITATLQEKSASGALVPTAVVFFQESGVKAFSHHDKHTAEADAQLKNEELEV